MDDTRFVFMNSFCVNHQNHFKDCKSCVISRNNPNCVKVSEDCVPYVCGARTSSSLPAAAPQSSSACIERLTARSLACLLAQRGWQSRQALEAAISWIRQRRVAFGKPIANEKLNPIRPIKRSIGKPCATRSTRDGDDKSAD